MLGKRREGGGEFREERKGRVEKEGKGDDGRE